MKKRGKIFTTEGGCWFCWADDDGPGWDLMFDSEFDTNVHVQCLKQALEEDPYHPEARAMSYILEAFTDNE